MEKFLSIINIQDDFESLIMIGDLHGHWDEISQFILKHNITKTCFYQVGDFGIGLVDNQEALLHELNGYLKQTSNCLYVIRGNHDNPKFFDEDRLEVFSHIKFLPDFTLLDIQVFDSDGNLNQKRILNIGGAISIDRSERTEGLDYFKNEGIQFDNIPTEFFNEKKYVDIIVTHTAPYWIYPCLILSSCVNEETKLKDPSLVKELLEERVSLGEIITHPNLQNEFIDKVQCFYGHFHDSATMESNGMEFSLLNINEFKEVRF